MTSAHALIKRRARRPTKQKAPTLAYSDYRKPRDPDAPRGGAQVAITQAARAFVVAYVNNGGRVREAAETAQISRQAGYALLRHPLARDLLADETRKVLVNHAPLAIKTLADILADEKASPIAKTRAAELILDRSGFNPRLEIEHTTAEKKPSGMSLPDLRSRLESLLAEVARRQAIDIKGEPAENVIDATAENVTESPPGLLVAGAKTAETD